MLTPWAAQAAHRQADGAQGQQQQAGKIVETCVRDRRQRGAKAARGGRRWRPKRPVQYTQSIRQCTGVPTPPPGPAAARKKLTNPAAGCNYFRFQEHSRPAGAPETRTPPSLPHSGAASMDRPSPRRSLPPTCATLPTPGNMVLDIDVIMCRNHHARSPSWI